MKTIKILNPKTNITKSIPIKEFWNMLGGSIGGDGLGEWMEYSETHPGASIEERRESLSNNATEGNQEL